MILRDVRFRIREKRLPDDLRLFLEEARSDWDSLGALVPSSRKMAGAITEHIPPSNDDGPRRFIEVGAGTGRFTNSILEKMGTDDSLVVFEPNPRFAQYIQDQISRHPAHADLNIELRREFFPGTSSISEHGRFDYGVCGLPFNSFPIGATEQIMDAFTRVLSPGGVLSYFEYCGLRELIMYFSPDRAKRRNFREIEVLLHKYHQRYRISRKLVVGNIPPALIHCLQFS